MSDWVTRMVKGEPRDLKLQDGKPVAVAAWRAPLRPLTGEACANCGAERQYDSGPISGDRDPPITCSACGLSETEDRALHRRYALKHGSDDYMKAARNASERGRNVMALKLATAAFHYGPDPVEARRLRAELLRTVGLDELAEEEESTTPLDGLSEADTADLVPFEPGVAAARTQLDEAPIAAGAAALERLSDPDTRSEALELLLRVAQRLTEEDPDHVVQMINAGAPHSHRSADLCFALARAEYGRRKLSACRRWLLHTRRLSPTHREALDLLDVVEDMMNIASTTGPFSD